MRQEYATFLRNAEESNEYWTQTAILDFTEELSRLMASATPEISRAELARRIGASPAYVTKVLRGNVNLTLATMTKLARAVGAVVRIHLARDGVVVTWTDFREVSEALLHVVPEELDRVALPYNVSLATAGVGDSSLAMTVQ